MTARKDIDGIIRSVTKKVNSVKRTSQIVKDTVRKIQLAALDKYPDLSISISHVTAMELYQFRTSGDVIRILIGHPHYVTNAELEKIWLDMESDFAKDLDKKCREMMAKFKSDISWSSGMNLGAQTVKDKLPSHAFTDVYKGAPVLIELTFDTKMDEPYLALVTFTDKSGTDDIIHAEGVDLASLIKQMGDHLDGRLNSELIGKKIALMAKRLKG